MLGQGKMDFTYRSRIGTHRHRHRHCHCLRLHLPVRKNILMCYSYEEVCLGVKFLWCLMMMMVGFISDCRRNVSLDQIVVLRCVDSQTGGFRVESAGRRVLSER